MNQGRLPDFLGIGAVKAGTTWLYRNLHRHPALYLPPTKPVRYFDRHSAKPIETYQAIFSPAGDRLCGEFSASYSVLPPETIRQVHALMPGLRLILLLREPKARAWSEARMEFAVVRGLGDTPVPDAAYYDFIVSDQCRMRGDYGRILANWWHVFPRAQVFVGLYDDVWQRPQNLLGRVLDFLGVPHDGEFAGFPLREKIFGGVEVPLPARCRDLLNDMYRTPQIREVGDLIGIDLVQRWDYQ